MANPLSDLSPRTRGALTLIGAIDLTLRVVALLDLRRRAEAEVRGSRRRWGVALAVVNSGGVLPVVYFTRARL